MAPAPSSLPQDWKPITDVLQVVARRFARTQAGRTGQATLDILIDAEELLAEANAAAGQLRVVAIADLEMAERAGLLQLGRNRRDPELLERVRFFPTKATELYDLLGLPSPAEQRECLARSFVEAGSAVVPSQFGEGWRRFCTELATAASSGESVQPFDRRELKETQALLETLPRLLTWNTESYLRFASCVLCGDSKTLEKWAPRIEVALRRVTGGVISTLADLGIVENPRSVTIHGPLRLGLGRDWLDLGLLTGVARVAANDINTAKHIESDATRCVSVENETTLHELAKLRSSDLLIGTSFLGSGTRRLFERLPTAMEFWHFGDSDPAGFAVLADIRERAGRTVNALHMRWRSAREKVPLSDLERRTAERLLDSRWLDTTEKAVLKYQLANDDKGAFEQETLGPPALPQFPFYEVI